MKACFTLLLFLSAWPVSAQTGYDRNQLVRFYQDQDYVKAIAYLLPFAGTVTGNVQYNNDLASLGSVDVVV